MGHLRWSLGTGAALVATTPGCSAVPLHPPGCSAETPGAGSGVCHRSRPFHTKHPVGKTHNFYTARSRWNRRPFEVLFAGHLQAFLITGSLRGASLPPGFCLPETGWGGGITPRWVSIPPGEPELCAGAPSGRAVRVPVPAWDALPPASSPPCARLCAGASSCGISLPGGFGRLRACVRLERCVEQELQRKMVF